jgi:hypothetical protein
MSVADQSFVINVCHVYLSAMCRIPSFIQQRLLNVCWSHIKRNEFRSIIICSDVFASYGYGRKILSLETNLQCKNESSCTFTFTCRFACILQTSAGFKCPVSVHCTSLMQFDSIAYIWCMYITGWWAQTLVLSVCSSADKFLFQSCTHEFTRSSM